jgi:hypothetical protein
MMGRHAGVIVSGDAGRLAHFVADAGQQPAGLEDLPFLIGFDAA